jgi:hypothetical protein
LGQVVLKRVAWRACGLREHDNFLRCIQAYFLDEESISLACVLDLKANLRGFV